MNRPGAERTPGGGPRRGPAGVLERVPLGVRMLAYGAVFLAAVLGGLPWLAYRLDMAVPDWHIELGPWRAIGVVVFAAFLALYIYCSFQLSRRGRGAYVEFDPPRRFVAEGPYRWCRNPIAASLLGMLLGEAVALSSTGVLLLFTAGLALAHAQVVLLEEPLLRRRFGAAYEDYLKRVPRWLPRRPVEAGP